ncbi:DUF2442 domain-containing protein [Pedobacter endophyticus]|uniref:DUF2442 domain-containing protein n=1 Tax=Pedobacter endophyticus TaxID=2789740 RepID=A0A7S9L2N6_9SPHI|nr:DUF2442 domain-containing protein [Pedobacter endophyticus]QPH41369.1 DUF2442 domain-containing protein [Pedobacter endophyticus]
MKVVKVKAIDDYQLKITFENEEEKTFDVKPYLNKGIFTELKEPQVFYAVKTSLGSITWPSGQDFSPETLYMEGK